jgi:ABC-2 type transport system permease protein
MTTTTTAADLTGAHLTFPRIVRSEWIKLRTIRSTVWCFGLIILLTIGFALLGASAGAPTGHPDAEASRQATVLVGTIGVSFSQLIIGVLGVLIISGEYSTGMIRATFTAVPGRLSAIFAKLAVLAVTTFVVSIVAIWLAALITAPILSGKGYDVQLSDPAVYMPLLGGSVYLTLIAILSFAIGSILRSSAGGIATALGLLLVLPIIANIAARVTNAVWISNVGAFLPASAGGQLYTYATAANTTVEQQRGAPVLSGAITLDGWQGFFVLLAWTVAGLIIATILVKRRDA